MVLSQMWQEGGGAIYTAFLLSRLQLSFGSLVLPPEIPGTRVQMAKQTCAFLADFTYKHNLQDARASSNPSETHAVIQAP